MAHRPEDVRNVALVGAGGAGKTTLAEALLHVAKATSRLGSIPEKNTVSDWDEDERERQHSIFATPLHLTWEGKRIHLIDTPGALDFIGEAVLAAVAAVEIAAICVNAHDGVGVATRGLYKAIREAGPALLRRRHPDRDGQRRRRGTARTRSSRPSATRQSR